MTDVFMFVNGQAMSGGDLNFALENTKFIGACRTAPNYRFYSVRDEFPGLWNDPDNGRAILGEVYELSYAQLRTHLLPNEPPELELSVIELSDGTGSLSMRMRDAIIGQPGVTEITEYGGWLDYLGSS